MTSMTHQAASLGRAVLAMLHRRWQRRAPRMAPVWRAGQDPTATIESAHDAVMFADSLLESVPRHQVCDEFWQTVALRPLAALLYAASRHGEQGGIGWVHRTVDNIYADAAAAGWYQAIEACRSTGDRAAAALAHDVLGVAWLSSRQRKSICVMMRAALAPLRPCDPSVRSA
jgi:hypothetical protein